MAKILQFPSIAENEARLASHAIDAEIAEIHAKVDNEIKERYGSVYGLGGSILKMQPLVYPGNCS